jgi:hypothetical protein
MPTKKSTATAKRIVDVAHPSTVKTDSSSVPLIVKNRPIMHDPMMVNTPEQEAPAEAPKPAKKSEPIIKKITLEPLAPLIKVGKADDDNEEPIPVMVTKSAPEVNETKLEETQPEVVKVEIPVVAAHNAEKVLKPSEATIAELAERAKVEKAQIEKPAAELKPGEAVKSVEADPNPASADPAVNSESSEPTGADAKEAPAASDNESAQGPEAAKGEPAQVSSGEEEIDTSTTDTDLLKDDKQTNPQAVKEARAAAEKQLALDKLISEGTYVLPINSVEKRRKHRSVAILFLIILVLGVAGFILTLDGGYVHIAGLSAPTDFLPN